MALFKLQGGDLEDDVEHFQKSYDCTYEEFIKEYGKDKIIIDLKDKIVVSLCTFHNYFDKSKKLPIELLTVLIPEEDKYKYTAELIYVGHIAFIKISYESGKVKYLFKDDECYPQNFDDALESGDLLFCAEEQGFTKEDILGQIEKFIQVNHDYNFKLDKDKLVILEGL